MSDDDIVNRLRLAAKPEEWASVWGLTVARCSLLREAADEIERLRRIVDWFVEDRNGDFIDVGDSDWQPYHTRPWIAYDGIGVDIEIPDEVIESFREYRRG